MPMATREAQREYQRRWKATRRAEWFKDKKCCRCGSTKNLELDHIDPSTKVDHQIWTWSQQKRDVELAKCQVLCKDCHKVKTRIDLIAMDINSRLRKNDVSGKAWCYVKRHFVAVSGFSKNRAKRRGIENECKECKRERVRKCGRVAKVTGPENRRAYRKVPPGVEFPPLPPY
jgi:hypothetical protein